MMCCQPSVAGTDRFFSRFAHRYRRRYLRRGLERNQVHLVEGLQRAGIEGASVLEIGSGVGYLHHALLKRDAAFAIGVDMSAQMLEEARALAAANGLSARVRYCHGDFVALAPTLPEADVTILDKTVCCYPDAEALVLESLEKTARVYALTYPRGHWFNRLGVKLMTAALWLLRSPFRTYVHDPARIERWIEGRGFRKDYEYRTLIWLTQIYLLPDLPRTAKRAV